MYSKRRNRQTWTVRVLPISAVPAHWCCASQATVKLNEEVVTSLNQTQGSLLYLANAFYPIWKEGQVTVQSGFWPLMHVYGPA